MRISRWVLAAPTFLGVAACDVLLGLGHYREVPCIPGTDCLDGTVDAPREAQAEAGGVDSGPDALDAPVEAAPDAPVEVDDAFAFDGGPLLRRWAQWPMPNPDASIGGDSSALLPHPMRYALAGTPDAGDGGDGPDAGGLVVDTVTGLIWERDGNNLAATPADAERHCLGQGMRVPSRIELVSIIDFTRTPAIDGTVFTGTAGDRYWTSSLDPGGSSWTVDFRDGTVYPASSVTYVRCVLGGGP